MKAFTPVHVLTSVVAHIHENGCILTQQLTQAPLLIKQINRVVGPMFRSLLKFNKDRGPATAMATPASADAGSHAHDRQR